MGLLRRAAAANSAERVRFPASLPITDASLLTVSLWIERNPNYSAGHLVNADDGNNVRGWHLHLDNGYISWVIVGSSNASFVTANGLPFRLVHLLCTWSGGMSASGLAVYYDTVSKSSQSTANGSGHSTGAAKTLTLLNNNDASPANSSPSRMADVAIWNRVLSASEIALLYRAGPSASAPLRLPSGLLLYAPLDGRMPEVGYSPLAVGGRPVWEFGTVAGTVRETRWVWGAPFGPRRRIAYVQPAADVRLPRPGQLLNAAALSRASRW